MDSNAFKRHEQRLSYRCPIWFGEDVTQALYPGLMEDVSSGGIAFTYTGNPGSLQVGQTLTVRLSLPRFGGDDPQATVGVTRTGHIRSITAASNGDYRVGLQFDTPLSLKPAEEAALTAACRDAAL